MRKLLYHASSVLVVTGLVIAIWPLGQNAYGRWSQRELRDDWDRAATSAPRQPARPSQNPPAPAVAPSGNEAKIVRAAPPSSSWPLTRLVIPDLQIDVVVVQGVESSDLNRGPGHYPGTAFPGRPGNCVIAGHRNIYGSWFYNLDQLVPGANIQLVTPKHTYTYRMLALTNISEADSSVLRASEQPGDARMTIITCTIPHSSERLVVTAELSQTI